MKIISIVLIALLGLLPVACSPLSTADQTKVVQGLTDATTALQATSAELKATAAVLPPTQAATVTKAAANVDKATPVVAGAATTAAQPGASALDVIAGVVSGAVPLIPAPYSTYVTLGLGALAILKTITSSKNAAAATTNAAVATSMQSGVTAALANGTLVAKPQAAATIDAQIIDHPIANSLVDAVTNSVAVNALQGK